jgi:hypothetical protein
MGCVVTGCTVVVATLFCSVLLFLCLKITFGLHEIIKSVWWTMKMQVILETRTWTWYEMLASWIFQRQPFLEIMTAGRQFHHLSHCLWVLQTFKSTIYFDLFDHVVLFSAVFNTTMVSHYWSYLSFTGYKRYNKWKGWSPGTTRSVSFDPDIFMLVVVLYRKSCETNGDALARYRLLR